MRLSSTRREAIEERKSANPLSEDQKESARKFRKKQNKIRIVAAPELEYKKEKKIVNRFRYEFEGGFWKVKDVAGKCFRKYKTVKAAIRFCKVANTEIAFLVTNK